MGLYGGFKSYEQNVVKDKKAGTQIPSGDSTVERYISMYESSPQEKLSDQLHIPPAFADLDLSDPAKTQKIVRDTLTDVFSTNFYDGEYKQFKAKYPGDRNVQQKYAESKNTADYMELFNLQKKHGGQYQFWGAKGDIKTSYPGRNGDFPMFQWTPSANQNDYGATVDELEEAWFGTGSLHPTSGKGYGPLVKKYTDQMSPNRGKYSQEAFNKWFNSTDFKKDYNALTDQRSKAATKGHVNDATTYVMHLLGVKENLTKLGEKTWGPDYHQNPEYQAWVERSIGTGDSMESILTNTAEGKNIKNIKLQSYVKPKPGISNNSIAGLSEIADFIESAANVAFDVVTAPVDVFVTGAEVTQDVVTGDSNVLEAVTDFATSVTGTDNIIDAAENLAEGDVVGATLDTYEYAYDNQANTESGSFVGNNPTGDLTNEIASAALDNIEQVTDPSNDNLLADLREDVQDIITGGDIETPTTEDIKLGDYESGKTVADLKALLGIAPDQHPSKIIESLIGDEARKMADDPDIMRMRELQGKVAEEGYDAGEREALSSRARRELAGRARAGGMAAGAAAGGLRGASVGAQARSLSEEAMKQQADVTTEMDKASIARKDEARRQLANLAKDVTRFDIDKEEERKKRKGATTIGVQSLVSQEELMKQQLDLAKQG